MPDTADTNRIDAVLQYALLAAGDQDDFRDRALGPIHLIKYTYIADLAFAEANEGRTFTGVFWRFYRFGPWAESVFDRIEPAMLSICAKEISSQANPDMRRWVSSNYRMIEEVGAGLPPEVRFGVQRAVHEHGADTKGLLHSVYRSAPMLHAAPGELLDLSICVAPHSALLPSEGSGASLSSSQRKQLIANFKARVAEGKKTTSVRRVVPRPPVYDDVFIEGLAWLDADCLTLGEEEGVLSFDAEVWKSSARFGEEIP